jgi:preprotein translocase subunit SecB
MAEENKKSMQLQRIYTKDVSLETPGVPDVFRSREQPRVDVQLSNGSNRIAETDDFEVTVTATVTARVNDSVVYLVEVAQAGIFSITGFEGDELEQVLGAYCPSIIFPYLREVISSLIDRASFPPFLLQPINFDALYREAKAKEQQGESSGGQGGTSH